MRSPSTIITGIAAAFIAFLGLFMAAGAGDEALAGAGVAFFAFGTLFCFWLLKRWFDAAEGR